MYRNVVGNSTAQGIIYKGLFMDTADFWSCFWDCQDEHCPFSLVHAFFQFCWRVPGSFVVHRWICAGLMWACSIHALGIGNILWITSLSCLWFCSWCVSERQTRPCLRPVSNGWITWNSSFQNALCHCWAGLHSSVPVNLNSLHTRPSTLFSMLLLSIESLLCCGFSHVLGSHGHDSHSDCSQCLWALF